MTWLWNNSEVKQKIDFGSTQLQVMESLIAYKNRKVQKVNFNN